MCSYKVRPKTSVLLHFIATSLASSGRFRSLTMCEDAEVLATGYGHLYDLDISQCQLGATESKSPAPCVIGSAIHDAGPLY